VRYGSALLEGGAVRLGPLNRTAPRNLNRTAPRRAVCQSAYGDAGTGWNNPTVEAIAEVGRIWPNRPIGCLLSIGTGLEKAKILGNGTSESYSWLLSKLAPKKSFKLDVARYCVDCLTSCEKSHYDACSKFSDRIVVDENYFRFNVPQGLSEIGLEEWEKISDVVDLTETHMDHGEIQRKKQAVANLLLNPQTAS
jgi:hypothetical protein